MPRGRKSIVSDKDLEVILKYRDEEKFSFSYIATLMRMAPSTVQSAYHRHHGTPSYVANAERKKSQLIQDKEQFGPSESERIQAKEFEGADVRRLWQVLNATSKLGGRL